MRIFPFGRTVKEQQSELAARVASLIKTGEELRDELAKKHRHITDLEYKLQNADYERDLWKERSRKCSDTEQQTRSELVSLRNDFNEFRSKTLIDQLASILEDQATKPDSDPEEKTKNRKCL